jgi:hypothetical protein
MPSEGNRMTNKIVAAVLLMSSLCCGAQLTQAANVAFGQYVSNLEARLARQHADADTHLAMLNLDPSRRNALERQLMSGEIRVEPVTGAARELPGALLHHWRGDVFVSNATPEEMLALLRDHNHVYGHYAPRVIASHALKDDGETAMLAMRLQQQTVRTIVLDAEYAFESRLASTDRGYSLSRSTHIWQVDDPGTPQERRRPEGDDEGFLWRLNSYWSFARMRGGLLIECEAVSLTRDIPFGFGWLVTPFVQNLPSEALQFTLSRSREALTGMTARKEQR